MAARMTYRMTIFDGIRRVEKVWWLC
jgi:hypothetical protein